MYALGLKASKAVLQPSWAATLQEILSWSPSSSIIQEHHKWRRGCRSPRNWTKKSGGHRHLLTTICFYILSHSEEILWRYCDGIKPKGLYLLHNARGYWENLNSLCTTLPMGRVPPDRHHVSSPAHGPMHHSHLQVKPQLHLQLAGQGEWWVTAVH